MDEYIFVSIFIIIVGSLIVKQRESLRSIIVEFVANQSDKEIIEEEDVVELEEIRDMIFDFVSLSVQLFVPLNYKDLHHSILLV